MVGQVIGVVVGEMTDVSRRGCTVLARGYLWGKRWLYSAVRLGGCVGDRCLEVEGIQSVAEMLGGLDVV